MRHVTGLFFVFSLVACVPDSDEYYTPLGSDSIDFAQRMTRIRSWYNQFNDTISNLALSEGLSNSGGEQRFTSRTQFYFDSLYLRVDASTSADASDIFGTKRDMVRIRFQRRANSQELLDSYIGIFPVLTDTTLGNGSSTWYTDTISWNDRQFFRPFILRSTLSGFEAVCDSTGNLLAFKTTDNRIFEPIN